jgi:hypothetical protein
MSSLMDGDISGASECKRRHQPKDTAQTGFRLMMHCSAESKQVAGLAAGQVEM